MNKKHLLLGLSLTISAMATGQVSLELPSEYINNNTTGGLNTLPANVVGSPYLNEDFTRGMVYVGDEKPYAALMRYNAYQDEIQINGSSGITGLFKRDYIRAVINGEKFIIAEYQRKSGTAQGYFVELNEGKTRLLKKYSKDYMEGETAVSSYPRFEEEVDYYLLTEGKPAVEIRLRKKDVLETMKANASMEEYVKKNKLRLKDEAEIIQFLNHFNSI